MVLTAQDDSVIGSALSAGTLIVDLGAGNDLLQAFYFEDYATPDLVQVDAGTGDDDVRLGEFFDSVITLGDGDDTADLSYLNAGAAATGARLYSQSVHGGAGNDVIRGGQYFTALTA